jgi:hypothetical protein
VIVLHPDCYVVNKGSAEMWQTILRLLAEEEDRAAAAGVRRSDEDDFWS